MRVAVLSDIHGNLRALEAVLADLEREGGADRIVAAGDLCLDGARGREVLDRLAAAGASALRGNCDRYIAEGDDEGEEDEIAWQRAELGPERVRFLGDLPFAIRIGVGADALLVVHANPKNDDEHLRPDADDATLERLTAEVPERTIAFGHLHVPFVRTWRDRTFVCVSSCGLPKDGDARASYAIFTQRSGGWQIRPRRVDYDVEKAARDLEKSGMPGVDKRIRTLLRHRYRDLHGLVT